MMKKLKMIGSVGFALTVLFYVTILMPPTESEAKTKTVAIEGIGYNVNASLAANLKALINKKVYVALDSGETFIGLVKEVGNHLVHLEKLDGKNHFDALIRIEDISAINTRFRTIQR
ncbi:MAG: hypothetical protein GY864_05595 [Desulfobacterales bacterium]|nr:hypothetical protein [Desulfobacterales bacterium]